MKTIETFGKDIEQAIMKGLAELGCKLDDVDVKIIEHPGIFRKARVEMTYHGDLETVEKKTAASVMRNLEARAAKASAEQRTSKQKNNRNSGKGDKRVGSDDARQTGEQVRGANARGGAENRPQQGVQENSPRQSAEKSAAPDVRKQTRELPQPQPKAALNKPIGADAKRIGAAKQDERSDGRNSGAAVKPERAEKPSQDKQASGAKEVREKAQKEISPEALHSGAKSAAGYLETLTELMGERCPVVYKLAGNTVKAELKTENVRFVGENGRVLDALEHLATIKVNGHDGRAVHFDLDCCGYRAKANEGLIRQANEAAEHAATTGKRVALPVMSSINRRVVHAALADRTDVITRSEGKDPHRYIVIIPRAAQKDGGAQAQHRTNGAKKRRGNNRHFRKNAQGKDNPTQ